MGLKTEQIVKILQLKGLGRKTAFTICNNALNEVIDTDNDLQELLLKYLNDKIIKRIDFTKNDLKKAIQIGDEIIDKSLNAGVKILSYYDNDFPIFLKDIIDKPILLNLKGDYKSLNKLVGVAIIGTREPTPEGKQSGEYFGEVFGKRGYNVVSGLAMGCDTAAHVGCLKGNGYTTAILAHGLHTIFPKENKYLAEEIVEKGGVLLSEYFYGVGALKNFFVERDRLQAGLSKGTIVIQTAEKGGTMHAVNATISSKKILAVVKYKPELKSEKVLGNEMLIREKGAFALTSKNMDELITLFNGDKVITSNKSGKSNDNPEILPSNNSEHVNSVTNDIREIKEEKPEKKKTSTGKQLGLDL